MSRAARSAWRRLSAEAALCAADRAVVTDLVRAVRAAKAARPPFDDAEARGSADELHAATEAWLRAGPAKRAELRPHIGFLAALVGEHLDDCIPRPRFRRDIDD